MATRGGPAEGWIDPDDFDRSTAEAAVDDPELAHLAASMFTDPHATGADDMAPSDELHDAIDEIHRPNVAELLADAAQIDPEPSLDERSFGAGQSPGSVNAGLDPADDIRLGPDLLPRPDHAPESPLAAASETTLESRFEDAFDDAFDDDFDAANALGPPDDPADTDLQDDGPDDPTDPFS